MKNDFASINDSKIYYEISGQGTPLILIHADTLDCRQWEQQVEFFAPKYRVITYDVRGFGKSEIPVDQAYSFAEDLGLLMRELKIKEAHIVGLSMGAAIAIDLALSHPDMVLSLTLADAGISGDGFGPGFVETIGAITKLAKQGKLDEAKFQWSQLPLFDFSRNMPDVWEQVQKMVAKTSGFRWYGGNQPLPLVPPAATRLAEIKVPTLIMVGEYDAPDFQRKARLLKEQIRMSQIVTITGAGHLSNMDNPGMFNKELNKFLAAIVINSN